MVDVDVAAAVAVDVTVPKASASTKNEDGDGDGDGDGGKGRLERLCFESQLSLEDGAGAGRFFEGIESGEQLQAVLEDAARLLDAVETELVDEVGAKADAFYDAMSALGSLADQTSSLMAGAGSLNSVLTDLQARHEREVARLQQLTHEQAVLLRAQQLLATMLDFARSQNVIQSMLDTHAFSDALKLVGSKIGVLRGELAGVQIFEPVLTELEEMKVALEKMQRADVLP